VDFRSWFSERGICIDDFVVTLDEGTHLALHYGNSPSRPGGWWNETIMKALKGWEEKLGRKLTPEEIMEVGTKMRKAAGIDHLPVHPKGQSE
jgi:hypothetical protein